MTPYTYYELRTYHTTRPDDRGNPFEFNSWQSAYAYAKRAAREDCSVLRFTVIHRSPDAYIYRGLWDWRRANGIN